MIRSCLLLLVGTVCLNSFANSAGCTSATFESQTYSTKEVVTASVPQYVIQFTVKCAAGSTGPSLYARINDQLHQVTRSSDGESFQVSWGGSASQLGSGTETVALYDEEGYQALKKVERSGGDPSEVKSLGSIDLSHSSVWKGPMVSSETVACLSTIALFYFAYSKKSQLLA